MVVTDKALFEGGAGETIRRALLKRAGVLTLPHLPTGILIGSIPARSARAFHRILYSQHIQVYAQGGKANVPFSIANQPRNCKHYETTQTSILQLGTGCNFLTYSRGTSLIISSDTRILPGRIPHLTRISDVLWCFLYS